MKALQRVGICLLLAVSTSACLKTRAQLKSDRSMDGDSISAQVPAGGYAIDEIKGEITRLTGRIEDLERENSAQNAANQQSQKAENSKLEERIIEIEQSQIAILTTLQKIQQKLPEMNPEEYLQEAVKQMQKGDFDSAITNLSTYIKSKKAKKVEDAYYLRGEAYYNTKQYKKAILDYSKFPERFHKSKKMPEALYKIGLSFEALGMNADAKGFFQELVDKFPKTSEAKSAKKRI